MKYIKLFLFALVLTMTSCVTNRSVENNYSNLTCVELLQKFADVANEIKELSNGPDNQERIRKLKAEEAYILQKLKDDCGAQTVNKSDIVDLGPL